MKKLDIIYEDKELLVVNKPSKMLTISDGKSDDTTQENITPIWNKTFCTVMTLSPQGASENGSDTL